MNDLSGIVVDKYLYWPHQLVGQGSFATVYRGKRRSDGLPVAVKKIKINEMSNRMNKLWSEIKIMKQLSHPNILKLYDVHLDLESEVIYLFLEWCDEGDLSQLIKLLKNPLAVGSHKTEQFGSAKTEMLKKFSSKKLTETEIRNYMEQIRCGLEYLHQQHILHRDLKPQNILLHQGTVKICDFGLSILADQNSLISTMCGSPLYMAPEVIKHEEYTIKADLWSCGVILYEMFYGVHPYPVLNYHELTVIVEKPINYPLETVISENGLKLLKSLLEIDHQKRIEWVDFFNHLWFKDNLNNLRRRGIGGEYQLDDSIDTTNASSNTKTNVLRKTSDNKTRNTPDTPDTRDTRDIRGTHDTRDTRGTCVTRDTRDIFSLSLEIPKSKLNPTNKPHNWSLGTSSSDEFFSYDSEVDELTTDHKSIDNKSIEYKSLDLDPITNKNKAMAMAIPSRCENPLPKEDTVHRNSHSLKKNAGFNMSQYIVDDYQTPSKNTKGYRDISGQSAPNPNSSFGQSYSPRLNFNSMGSQVYKCVSKSYGVLKKNL